MAEKKISAAESPSKVKKASKPATKKPEAVTEKKPVSPRKKKVEEKTVEAPKADIAPGFDYENASVILSVRHLKQYFKLGGTGAFKYNKAVHDVSFDVYRGEQVPEGMKSLAFNVSMRSPDHTLTDEEADKVTKKILTLLERELGITLRS